MVSGRQLERLDHYQCHRHDRSLLIVFVLDRIHSLEPSPFVAIDLDAVDFKESTLDWTELCLFTLHPSRIDSLDLVMFS